MRSVCVTLAALAALAFVVSPAQAQRGAGAGPAMYLAAKSVQDELKLSADDAKKITDELGKIPREVRGAERAEKTQKILTDNLKPEQIKRLNQIMWQRGGIAAAMNNPEVQSALKLEDAQKEKIRGIQREGQQAIRDAAGDREKAAAARKKMTEDIEAALTADQKKAWKDLLGAEFKGEIPRPRPPANP
jgi:hypothetical protein